VLPGTAGRADRAAAPVSEVLAGIDTATLTELAPLLRRVVALDAAALVRVRAGDGIAAVFARLPFGVLVGRSLHCPDVPHVDATVRAGDLLAHGARIEAGQPDGPRTPAQLDSASLDLQWRGALPPLTRWRRLDVVADAVIRPLVRQGALALKTALDQAGSAMRSAAVAEPLLGAVALSVTGVDGDSAPVTLRMLSALTRMGFLPRGGVAVVSVSGGWTRLAAEYGSVYAEPTGLTLRSG
jgi:hypothetical protein